MSARLSQRWTVGDLSIMVEVTSEYGLTAGGYRALGVLVGAVESFVEQAKPVMPQEVSHHFATQGSGRPLPSVNNVYENGCERRDLGSGGGSVDRTALSDGFCSDCLEEVEADNPEPDDITLAEVESGAAESPTPTTWEADA